MSIEINIENYEAYLLDLAEGNLSFAEEKALIQFLSRHPELEVDLEELPILEAEASTLQEGFKSTLFRAESTGLAEKDHLMISAVEGELTNEEKERLGEILGSDENAQNDLAYYHKTKLPLEEISYPLKDQLIKRESRVLPLWTTISSIAAAVLILIYFGLPQESSYTPRTFSYQVEDTKVEEADFAFIVEVESEDRKEEKSSTENKQGDLGTTNYLAENPEKIQKEDPKKKTEVEQTPEQIDITPIDRQTFAVMNNDVQEKTPVSNEEEVDLGDLADNTTPQNVKDDPSNEDKVLNPLEYARELIKKDVLNNRSLKESVKDEVANLTNKKVNFDQEEHEAEAQFALNIGKLKIRKK